MYRITISFLLWVCIYVFTTNAASRAQKKNSKVIYGEDDRKEYFEVEETLQTIVKQSILAKVLKTDLVRIQNHAGIYELRHNISTMEKKFNLCEGEKYGSQPSASTCAGTLVSSNTFVTAGHCLETQQQCDDYYWIFNFYLESKDQLATITSDDIYSCKYFYYVDIEAPTWKDWAVVRLDRNVSQGHNPVQISSRLVKQNDQFTMIGFGGGVPVKIDTNVKIAKLFENYFSGYIDSFLGNSGSGIFDEELKLIGILVRGHSDFSRIRTLTSWCSSLREMSLYSDPNDIEEIDYIWMVIKDFCENKPKKEFSANLCCGSQFCEIKKYQGTLRTVIIPNDYHSPSIFHNLKEKNDKNDFEGISSSVRLYINLFSALIIAVLVALVYIKTHQTKKSQVMFKVPAPRKKNNFLYKIINHVPRAVSETNSDEAEKVQFISNSNESDPENT